MRTLLIYMDQKHLGLREQNGRTALHLGVWEPVNRYFDSQETFIDYELDRVEVVRLLLEAMTQDQIDILDGEGKSASEIAHERGKPAMIELFESHALLHSERG